MSVTCLVIHVGDLPRTLIRSFLSVTCPVPLPSDTVTVLPGGRLHVSDVSPALAGTYTCTASNHLTGELETAPFVTRLQVQRPQGPAPPRLVVPPEPMYRAEPDSTVRSVTVGRRGAGVHCMCVLSVLVTYTHVWGYWGIYALLISRQSTLEHFKCGFDYFCIVLHDKTIKLFSSCVRSDRPVAVSGRLTLSLSVQRLADGDL